MMRAWTWTSGEKDCKTLTADRMVRLHTNHHVIPKGSNDVSVITTSPSSSSLEITGAWEWTLRLRLASKREKMMIVCLAVRNSALENIRLQASSLAVIIDLTTCAGFAFWPVVFPIRNSFVKYSLCFSENLALLV